MLLKLNEMPTEGIRLCKVLAADKIRKRSSLIDGFPGLNGTTVKKESGTEASPQPSEALVNACWRMVRACIHDDGVGLAAPQIGIMKRMFIIREDNESFKVYFHPRYTVDANSKVELGLEGCLSVPGKSLMIPRATVICAEWQEITQEGSIVGRTELLEGFKARVFQHEYDHLDGISILDRSKNYNPKTS